MDSGNKCVKLSVIPQFSGSCWFNAILMISLYSQLTRRVLIKTAKHWDKTNSFFQILKSILIKYYREPEKAQDFYNKIRPEIMLYKLIKYSNNKGLANLLKKQIKKNYVNLGYYETYITTFFDYLQINSLEITYTKDNKYLFNFYKEVSNVISNQGEYQLILKHNITTNEEVYKDIKNSLKNVPDIITVIHKDLNKNRADNYQFFANIKKYDSYYADKYKCKIKGVSNYEDIIYLNGHKYKLDAFTLTNYNEMPISHVIAGITCDNERYIYNGWQSTTNDPAMQYGGSLNNQPCALMKYNWDLRKDETFCLNQKTCKLDFVTDHSQLCFSAGKNSDISSKTLIYVRVKDNEVMNSLEEEAKLSIPENLKISGLPEIINDMFDISILTDDEIKAQLEQFGTIPIPYYHYERKTLESMLYDEIANYYNLTSEVIQDFKRKGVIPKLPIEEEEEKEEIDFKIKKPAKKNVKKEVKKEKEMTKGELIRMILQKYPTMTGLTSKNKSQLNDILLNGKITPVKNTKKEKSDIPKNKSKPELISLISMKLPKLTKSKLEELLNLI